MKVENRQKTGRTAPERRRRKLLPAEPLLHPSPDFPLALFLSRRPVVSIATVADCPESLITAGGTLVLRDGNFSQINVKKTLRISGHFCHLGADHLRHLDAIGQCRKLIGAAQLFGRGFLGTTHYNARTRKSGAIALTQRYFLSA
jgi:hypothetical protein